MNPMHAPLLVVLAGASPIACAGLATSPDLALLTETTNGLIDGIQLDLAGILSFDTFGSPLNETIDVFIGSGWLVHSIAWDITISTIGSSWLSEVNLGFVELEGQPAFVPGAGDDHPGTATYSSGGRLSLAAIGIEPFRVDSDGIISIEIFESFDDVTGAADAQILSGSQLTLYYVPSPSTLAMLGFAHAAAARRKR